LLKLNPLFAWSFAQVKAYIDANDVPVNKLLSQGYKSVGDWHSTAKSGEGDAGEREGRWKDKAKTECGLHIDQHALKKQAMKQQVRLHPLLSSFGALTIICTITA
jgi:phosphoadenosine phosphosulfate reductase